MLCSHAVEHLEIERRANLPSFTQLLHVTPNRSTLYQRHKPCAHLPCSHLSWKNIVKASHRLNVSGSSDHAMKSHKILICHWDFKILLQLHLVGFDQQSWDFIYHTLCSRCWKSRWQWTPNLFEEAALLVALDRAPDSSLLRYSTFSEVWDSYQCLQRLAKLFGLHIIIPGHAWSAVTVAKRHGVHVLGKLTHTGSKTPYNLPLKNSDQDLGRPNGRGCPCYNSCRAHFHQVLLLLLNGKIEFTLLPRLLYFASLSKKALV